MTRFRRYPTMLATDRKLSPIRDNFNNCKELARLLCKVKITYRNKKSNWIRIHHRMSYRIELFTH
jgi:threonine synthase